MLTGVGALGLSTENLKVISDHRIRTIISKEPKYRFPCHIDFNELAYELQKVYLNSTCWGKWEYAESNALKERKLSIYKTIDYIFHLTPIIQTFYFVNLNFLFDI